MKQPKFMVNKNGDKLYLLDGSPHRLDGPAVIRKNGDKAWYLHGRLHRENGPALETTNGSKYYFRNGKLHRDDGPALYHVHTRFNSITKEEWWLEGVQYKEEDFYDPAHRDVAPEERLIYFLKRIIPSLEYAIQIAQKEGVELPFHEYSDLEIWIEKVKNSNSIGVNDLLIDGEDCVSSLRETLYEEDLLDDDIGTLVFCDLTEWCSSAKKMIGYIEDEEPKPSMAMR